ncbi:MAG: PA14 domain-containing protein, partial [Saprospiraceae bacterium]
DMTLARPGLGEIYHVAVYNKALTASDITQHFGAGNGCASESICKGPAGTGLTREIWSNIGGTSITSMTGLASYPNSPNSTDVVAGSVPTWNTADNYGSRVRGYITPTVSGNYTFWLTGDDQTQLYLSTNSSPASKVMIASIAGWTNQTEFNKYASQKSAVIALTAGQDYYVELLHKEGGGGDGWGIYWQAPGGGATPVQVPLSTLSPWQPDCECNKTALMVVGNLTLGTGDAAIRNRLQSLGMTVTLRTDVAVTAADATGRGLVLVSSTSLSTNIGNRLTNVAVPIINYEPALFDELNMTGPTYGTDNGVFTENRVNVLMPNHPIAANMSGWRTVLTAANTMTWGKPNANAAVIAEVPNNPDKEAIFCYETGATMFGMAAPARRVGFFLHDVTPANMTADGWKFFDNAVRWATNCSSLNPIGLAAPTDRQLTFDANRSGEAAQLNWISTTGATNDYFVIERSADGQRFAPIAQVDGRGEEGEMLYFSELDENPLPGTNHYRLRLVQMDGSEHVTDARQVEFAAAKPFSVYPNPASSQAFVDLSGFAGKNVQITLVNPLGQIVRMTETTASADIFALDLQRLDNGIYTVVLRCEGDQRAVKLAIRQQP